MQSMLRRTLISLLTLSVPLAVDAQAPVRLAGAEMALWPEYDRPSMLVICRLTIDESVPLPAALAFSIPAAAGVPNAVAERVGDSLMSLAYERVVSGEIAQLRFVANSRVVQVEYYDPGLGRDGTSRSYESAWMGDYAVDALDFVVQHPPGASDVVIEPPAEPAQQGNDGLRYQRVALGSMAAGEVRGISLRYERADDTLTSSLMPPPSSSPPAASAADPPATGAAATPVTLVLMILLAFGIAGLLIGILMRVRSRDASAATGAGGDAFCTRCGQPARRDDRFCGKCGARLKTS